MKKVLVGALAVGLLYSSTASAYHIIKQHREEPVVAARPVAEELQQGRSATATVRTDRSLLSLETSDAVYDGDIKTVAAKNGVAPYRMRSGDNVQLIVYGHDDLSTKVGTSYTPYVVRPDGKLSVPLIGDVDCADKTVAEVVNEITTRLAEYIIDPKVSINITKLGTTRVTILGEVTRQGNYELEKSHNLVDAIGAASGFTQKASKRKVYVVRRGMNEFVAKVNVLDVLKSGKKNSNPELQEGDIVYISSNHKLALNTILSQITSVISAANDLDEMDKRKK